MFLGGIGLLVGAILGYVLLFMGEFK